MQAAFNQEEPDLIVPPAFLISIYFKMPTLGDGFTGMLDGKNNNPK